MIEVVVECSINWEGNLNRAKKMIFKAAQAGASAVKFQAFRREHVEHLGERADKLLESSLNKDSAKELKKYADSWDIEFLCTPFYIEAIDFLEEIGVKRYKIRELDARPLIDDYFNVPPLIEKALATGKEVLISAQRRPVRPSMYFHERIKWLYCVPLYPPEIEEIAFWKIPSFYGYSNHYPDPLIPYTAALYGAKMVEVHFSLGKIGFLRKHLPLDHNVSLSFTQLSNLCSWLERLPKMKLKIEEDSMFGVPVFS